jgi:hypothetical protein
MCEGMHGKLTKMMPSGASAHLQKASQIVASGTVCRRISNLSDVLTWERWCKKDGKEQPSVRKIASSHVVASHVALTAPSPRPWTQRCHALLTKDGSRTEKGSVSTHHVFTTCLSEDSACRTWRCMKSLHGHPQCIRSYQWHKQLALRQSVYVLQLLAAFWWIPHGKIQCTIHSIEAWCFDYMQ